MRKEEELKKKQFLNKQVRMVFDQIKKTKQTRSEMSKNKRKKTQTKL